MSRPSVQKTGPTPKRTRAGAMPKMRSPFRAAVGRAGRERLLRDAATMRETIATRYSLTKGQRQRLAFIEQYEREEAEAAYQEKLAAERAAGQDPLAELLVLDDETAESVA